ncbi:hypothetical protein [Lysobacter sp. Hz 25]|uniref:hypothetical protein n=1 Tax=Lysobacter sp. Hz 25 TaxID=3383698 RepID=UPI0038D49D3F
MTPTPAEKTGEFERADNGWVFKYFVREAGGLALRHEVFENISDFFQRVDHLFNRVEGSDEPEWPAA